MFGTIKLHHEWGFLETNHEIGKYYRKLFLLQYCLKLQRPSNGEHITIISPWDNITISNFHHLNGQQLEFEVNTTLYWNYNALWLDVISDDINKFRKQFNLNEPDFPLHFCIGYIGENENEMGPT